MLNRPSVQDARVLTALDQFFGGAVTADRLALHLTDIGTQQDALGVLSGMYRRGLLHRLALGRNGSHTTRDWFFRPPWDGTSDQPEPRDRATLDWTHADPTASITQLAMHLDRSPVWVRRSVQRLTVGGHLRSGPS